MTKIPGDSGASSAHRTKGSTEMARINTQQLVANATTVGARAYLVQRDPSVRKAWGQFGVDFARAAKSFTAAAIETRSVWERTAIGGSAAIIRLQP